jgi:hypothetical protein
MGWSRLPEPPPLPAYGEKVGVRGEAIGGRACLARPLILAYFPLVGRRDEKRLGPIAVGLKSLSIIDRFAASPDCRPPVAE